MEDEEAYYRMKLQECSYRLLQQTAKSMRLPSNVKKVYLIQLILTAKYRSQAEAEALGDQVRMERQKATLERKKTQRRKKYVQQSTEISSTSNQSPPITSTPKRVSHVLIRYSPEQNSPVKYPSTQPARKFSLTSSDRVLRSSNRVKKPSYLLNNTLMSLINGSSPEESNETRVNIARKADKFRKVNRTYARQKSSDSWSNGIELVPVPRSVNIISSQPPAKRQRRISGIYPLNPGNIKLPSVAVRRADGTLSQLRAIIQKPQRKHSYEHHTNQNRSLLCTEASERPQTAPIVLNIPTSIGYRVNMTQTTPNVTYRANMTQTTPNLGYRIQNMSQKTQNISNRAPNNSLDMPQSSFNYSCSSEDLNLANAYKDNNCENYAVYYHKKIRAEQVRSNRVSRDTARSVDNECHTARYVDNELHMARSVDNECHTARYVDNELHMARSVDNECHTARYIDNELHMARSVDNECRLPRITEVFSKFNSVSYRDVTQPIYVQVETEPEIAPAPQYIPDPRLQYQSSSCLEKLYNMKVPHTPLLQIATTSNTRTIYCTPVISTAKAQPPSTAVHNEYNIASASQDSQQQPYFTDEEIPPVQDFFRNFRSEEKIHDSSTIDFGRSCSPVETLTSQDQELGANVTIPEMVEDALEIISQDGDYMERMGMDIRMQCILCNWAGPKIILEYHVRKEHPSEIIQCPSNSWCIMYTLGALSSQRVWVSRLLERRGVLYVLSAKYEDPDYFMAALSTLSSDDDTPKSGSITIYNKVTGEPFTWKGDVTQLPPSMPYENDPNCFRLQLSRMELLPNSANLKLLNRELVVRSPTKVVVGQPELDSINICLIVKIFD